MDRLGCVGGFGEAWKGRTWCLTIRSERNSILLRRMLEPTGARSCGLFHVKHIPRIHLAPADDTLHNPLELFLGVVLDTY